MAEPYLYQDPRDGRWYVFFCLNGRRLKRSCRTADRRQAEKILRAFKERLMAGRGVSDRVPSKRLLDFIPEVVSYYSTSRARKTTEAVRLALTHLARLEGNPLLSEIDFAMVEHFKQSRLRERVSARTAKLVSKQTVNLNLGSLSAALAYARKMGYLREVPRLEKLRLNRSLPASFRLRNRRAS